MSGRVPYDFQIGHRRADILGSDIGATKALNRTSERLPQGVGLIARWVAENDRLAAAEG